MCWVAGTPLPDGHPFRAIQRASDGRDASPRSGSSAAPTTARSSPRTSDCRTPSRTSSATVAASRRRCIFIARNYRPSADHPAAEGDDLRLGARRRHRRRGAPAAAHARALARRIRAGAAPRAAAAGRSGGATLYAGRAAHHRARCGAKAIVGTADQVAARLRELAQRLSLDELVIVTWTYDAAPRQRSYELLASEFGTRATSLLW